MADGILPGAQTTIPTLQPLPSTPGAYTTPDSLEQMRNYAKYLMQGSGQQPVHHWTQGLSNMVSALLGGDMSYRAGQRELASREYTGQNYLKDYQGMIDRIRGGGQAATAAPSASSDGGDQPTETASAQPATSVTNVRAVSSPGQKVALAFNDLRKEGRGYATDAGIDPDIYEKQISQESGWKNLRPNYAGARGIAQFIPSTAQQEGVDPMDVHSSLKGAANLDRKLIDKYGGNVGLALAEYNAGPRRVSEYLSTGRLPNETRNYVQSITGKPIEFWAMQGTKGGGAPTAGQALQAAGVPATGLALPFSGEPAPGQAPGQAPTQVAQAQPAGGGQMAAYRAPPPGVTGPGAPTMGQAWQDPSLYPYRPPVSSRDFAFSVANPWLNDEQKAVAQALFLGQMQPVQMQDPWGNVYIHSPLTGATGMMPGKQIRKMGDAEFPYTVQPGPGGLVGRPVPMEGAGEPPPVADQPAALTDKPFDLIPKKGAGKALPFSDEGQRTAGLPPEITTGHSIAAGPLTAKPPGDAKPGALAFGTSQVPTAQGGRSIESMSPDEYMRWKQQRDIDTEAAKGYTAADTKNFMDDFNRYQSSAIQAENLGNEFKYAKQLAQDWQLRQGPGAGILTDMDKFLSFFGDKDAAQRVTMAQTFEKLTSGTILADMRSKLERLGQVRLAEIDLLRKAAQAQGNTVGANMAILDLGERMQAQMRKIGEISRMYKAGVRWNDDGTVRTDRGGNPVMDRTRPTQEGLQGAITMYVSHNPLYGEGEVSQKIKEMKGEGIPPGAGTGVQPPPSSKPEENPELQELRRERELRKNIPPDVQAPTSR